MPPSAISPVPQRSSGHTKAFGKAGSRSGQNPRKPSLGCRIIFFRTCSAPRRMKSAQLKGCLASLPDKI